MIIMFLKRCLCFFMFLNAHHPWCYKECFSSLCRSCHLMQMCPTLVKSNKYEIMRLVHTSIAYNLYTMRSCVMSLLIHSIDYCRTNLLTLLSDKWTFRHLSCRTTKILDEWNAGHVSVKQVRCWKTAHLT